MDTRFLLPLFALQVSQLSRLGGGGAQAATALAALGAKCGAATLGRCGLVAARPSPFPLDLDLLAWAARVVVAGTDHPHPVESRIMRTLRAAYRYARLLEWRHGVRCCVPREGDACRRRDAVGSNGLPVTKGVDGWMDGWVWSPPPPSAPSPQCRKPGVCTWQVALALDESVEAIAADQALVAITAAADREVEAGCTVAREMLPGHSRSGCKGPGLCVFRPFGRQAVWRQRGSCRLMTCAHTATLPPAPPALQPVPLSMLCTLLEESAGASEPDMRRYVAACTSNLPTSASTSAHAARAPRDDCPEKAALLSRKTPLYNNATLEAPSGLVIARLDRRKVQWYLVRA
jgi:hypothetical protein